MGGEIPGLDLLRKWAGAPHWRPEEGVALAFGIDPAEVREARSDPNSRIRLSMKQQIAHFAELARRAVEMGDLPQQARPFQFVDWAARIGLRFHRSWAASFVEHTEDFGPRMEGGQEQRRRQDRSAKHADRRGLTQVRTEKEITKPELSPRTQEEPATAGEKPLQTRERETMLKLIIGMAIDAYGYDPRLKRSPTAREIAELLKELNLELDQDTVRKYLTEGKQFLSSETVTRKFSSD